MAAKRPPRRPSHGPATLSQPTPAQQQVLSHVLNSIAFVNFNECCSVEALAEHFGRTSGRMLSTLRKLVESGHLTLRGKEYQWVYPTVAALRKQDPSLSEAAATKILAKIGASRKDG